MRNYATLVTGLIALVPPEEVPLRCDLEALLKHEAFLALPEYGKADLAGWERLDSVVHEYFAKYNEQAMLHLLETTPWVDKFCRLFSDLPDGWVWVHAKAS